MTRSLSTADNLLEQLRDRIRWSVSAIYLTYFAFWLTTQGRVSDQLLRDARTWVACVAVLALSTAAVPVTSVLRSHLFLRVLTLGAALGVLGLVHQTLTGAGRQAEMLAWLNIIILLVFTTFGSLAGLTLVGIMLLVLVAILLTGIQWPDPEQKVLLAGLFSAVAFTAIGFLIMRFIEQHLSLHEQTTDQLAAARKDALTGVLGRAALEDEMRRTIQHARKTGTPLSLIVTDIDHFKRVNDQFGHGAGDDVLRSFAKRLRRNVGGSGGLVGRWGGEEFVVLLPGVARPDAVVMAERLRQEVSHAPVAGQEVTASFGVASYRRSGDDIDTLFGRADERLYEAKNAGRNAVRG